ncbi:hypothetical protein EDB84DRAFT_1394614 [Lactarius hengduanensis]|nr:hypothetical protein EDB84DRAFT_1394614 [Lactarius hengduanensis]
MDYNTSSSPLWDFPQSPSAFSQSAENDFLALLQKQFDPDLFPANAYAIPHDGVDPSKISNLTTPAPPPPLSDDSSPSPPSTIDHLSSSRRQSTNSGNEQDSPELKRKASDDALDDESPNQKASKKSSSRRKSTGNPSQDESRLLKRKEQNRAAQRAFRERKEKHVKDLEDQLAELEAKNLSTETENQHLKELLKRLQDENVSLKNTSFTFTVPRNGELNDRSFDGNAPAFPSSQNSIFAPTSHIPSPSSSAATKVTTPQSPSLDTPSAFPGDIDFGSLTPLDAASLDLLDDDAIMSYDFGYGQFVPSRTPYKTIASNPMFMSFADPSPSETGHASKSTAQQDSNGGSPFDLTFGQWSGQTTSREGTSHSGSLDELFGGHIFDTQSPINFNVLIKSAATSPISPVLTSSLSPVVHQSLHTPPAASSSNTSPSFESSDGSSPAAGSRSDAKTCPKTRAQMEQQIQAEGSSMFAPPPPQEQETQSQIFRAPAGADAPMVVCKGAAFPPTEKNEHNIDVLTAWRSITSHPHFPASKVDELCSEFADKARCDGTKVVLNPQGVNSILEKLTTGLTSSP